MDSTRKKLRHDHMEALQGLSLPEEEREEVLEIAEALSTTLNKAVGRLAFDAEPGGFARAMAELAGRNPAEK